MADKKSETPLYDKHKKYHDITRKLQELHEDKHHLSLLKNIHHKTDDLFKKYSGDKDVIDWKSKDEKDHRKFTDELWEHAAETIAKKYLNLKDEDIQKLRKQKNIDGETLWESMMAPYMGGLDKEHFFRESEHVGVVDADSVRDTYSKTLIDQHGSYRRSALLRKEIKTLDDKTGVENYLADAAKHNKESLKKVKIPKQFRSIDDAIKRFNIASQYMPKNYHPDKKDTHY